jgi:hypothetical protein
MPAFTGDWLNYLSKKLHRVAPAVHGGDADIAVMLWLAWRIGSVKRFSASVPSKSTKFLVRMVNAKCAPRMLAVRHA